MEFTKLDPTTLQVVKPVETTETTKIYKLDYLRNEETEILKQINEFVEAKNLELAEIRLLISEAEKLGIKSEIALEIIKK